MVVKNIGLHVGGGPNDAKTKAPLQQAVEKRFEAFRQCYALTDGKKSGTVGADLFIAAAGGAPKVRALRISFRGKEIRACIETAFGTVEFPSRQVPVVISYSLSFTPKP